MNFAGGAFAIIASSKKRSIALSFKTSAAILTVVKVETDAVMRLYNDWNKLDIDEDSQEYFAASFTRNGQKHRIITAQQNAMGMTAAAFLASKIITLFRPEYLIMCGIAAGIGSEAEHIYGDVMIPDVVWDYSAGKFTVPKSPAIIFGNLGFMPRPVSLALDKSVLEIVRSLQNQTEFKIHIGPMACGSSVVANRAIIEKQINSFMPDTVGLDMESYGVFYAANNSTNPKPKAIVIKSICDYADSQKSDKYQKFAAYTSSECTKYLLENALPFTL